MQSISGQKRNKMYKAQHGIQERKDDTDSEFKTGSKQKGLSEVGQ